MGFDKGPTYFRDGRSAETTWFNGQGGFRADWLPEDGQVLTFQGDFYGGETDRAAPGHVSVDGQNLLGRWTYPLAEESDVRVQIYWDRTYRRIPNTLTEALNTYDIGLEHRLPIGERHKLIWGAGYRFMRDEVGNTPGIAFLPARRDLHLATGFVQDEIALLRDRLYLTVGTKLEHNDYSGFEFQPSARIAWRAAPDQTVWAAVSRAVRSPSRIDTEVFAPATPPFALRGGGDRFDSEKVIAYELGYRADVATSLGVSLATFYNDYDDIRSVEPIEGAPGQTIILNKLKANTYGFEVSAVWQPIEWWRLRGGYTFFKKHIDLSGSADINQGRGEGNDPHHQFLIHSMVSLPANLEFDSVLRYVDNLNQRGPVVPSYLTLDLRLGWQPTSNWEFAIVGQNLLERRHAEFGAPATRQEIPRGVYAKATWKFSTAK
jgi:iron complex outermembrane receptor protein